MSTKQDPTLNWKTLQTQTITAAEWPIVYRELGTNNPALSPRPDRAELG
jgi:hypothetical protein